MKHIYIVKQELGNKVGMLLRQELAESFTKGSLENGFCGSMILEDQVSIKDLLGTATVSLSSARGDNHTTSLSSLPLDAPKNQTPDPITMRPV
jgi:hypothetical protein